MLSVSHQVWLQGCKQSQVRDREEGIKKRKRDRQTDKRRTVVSQPEREKGRWGRGGGRSREGETGRQTKRTGSKPPEREKGWGGGGEGE